MRERLIDIVDIALADCLEHMKQNNLKTTSSDFIVDRMLECGVIVPPCKVGQKVYQTILLKDKTGFIVERKVVGFHMGDFPELRGHKRKQYLIVYHDATNSITHIDINQIGKTVFLTKEEAEQALSKLQANYRQVRKEDEGKW